jgi:hypothetical protein
MAKTAQRAKNVQVHYEIPINPRSELLASHFRPLTAISTAAASIRWRGFLFTSTAHNFLAAAPASVSPPVPPQSALTWIIHEGMQKEERKKPET